MSLIKDLLDLRSIRLAEEAIEVQSAENVWKENKGDAGTYISNTVYFVRPDGSKFEVTVEKNGKREPFATLSRIDLDKSFTPMRPNQNPDAEGFIQYRDVDEVEAFPFAEETLKLNTGVLLRKGDFLVRKIDGDDFVYEVQKAKDFDAAYTKK